MNLANKNAPFGIRPINSGAKVIELEIIATNSVIYVGDPLKMTATGQVDLSVTAGDTIVGTSAEYKAASKGGKILVWGNPNEDFVAQMTGTASALQTHIGNLVNHSIANGSPTTLVSGHGLDVTTVGTSSILTFIIKGIAKDVDNIVGQYAKMVVGINKHLFNKPGAGV